MTTRYYALCQGAGLRICDSCRRHADHNPGASTNPSQAWVAATRNDRCAQWMGKPARAAEVKEVGHG